jgi:SAM-dependent methyltransferase
MGPGGCVPTNDESAMPAYSLGHSDQELERLSIQARLVEPITRRFLSDGGITAGMRVLDVGSGAGDVAFLAAELVGPDGSVTGTDRAGTALEVARQRASARTLSNVRFVEGDPAEMEFDGPFDAVVGRYVLMFQEDPVAMLRGTVRHLRAGGVVVFHEPYREGLPSYPPIQAYNDARQLIDEVLRLTGGDPSMGIKLHSTFVRAGLPSPTMRMESMIAGGDCSDHVHYEMDIVKTLLPEMLRFGLVEHGTLDADALADEVISELAANNGVVVSRSEVGAWTEVATSPERGR